MNIKPNLKVVHLVEDLINFIEKNNSGKVQKIIDSCPKIIKKTKMDDLEPIYYSVRYANYKIFKIILEKSTNYKYDENKLLNYILTYGNSKILKFFIEFYKINLNIYDKAILQNIFKIDQPINYNFVNMILNEVNFCYSIKINLEFYKMMKYNFLDEKNLTDEITITFNKNENGVCTEIEEYIKDKAERFLFVFIRYNKLYLVKTKSIKKSRLNDEDFEKLVRYL